MRRVLAETFTIFAVGAVGYGAIEVLVRGHSHISMAVLGGVSMIAIHLLGDDRRDGASFIGLLTMSALFITACEFLAGEILNVGLKMHIWSYCKTPLNIDGVICLRYSVCWVFLSVFGFVVDDLVRWKIFGEPLDLDYLKNKRACSL